MKDKKVETLEFIEKVRTKGMKDIEFGGELKKLGQQIVDTADAVKPIINSADSSSMDWELIYSPFRHIDQELDRLNSQLPITVASTVASGVSTATYSMATPTFLDSIMQFAVKGGEETIKSTVQRLNQIFHRRADKSQALSLLHEFGLSASASGSKSPTDHLEVAWASFEGPVTLDVPSITSLLPMRECINITISTLLLRRPTQEPAKGERGKVLSIYRQLKQEETPEWQIDAMVKRWQKLNDELSDSKEKNISRDEWGKKLREATLFLIDFLESLDKTKMRT